MFHYNSDFSVFFNVFANILVVVGAVFLAAFSFAAVKQIVIRLRSE